MDKLQIDFELLKAFYKEAYDMGYHGKLVGGNLGRIDRPEDMDVARALLLAIHNLNRYKEKETE